MKKLVKITKNQIVEKGVQSLADRPNASAQYGVGGLSPSQLKIWFDKLATFLAEKINEIYDTISADDAAQYIRIALDDYGVDSLGALVEAMLSGDFADKILQVFPSANSFATVSLQKYINDAAQAISENTESIEDLDKDKLDKVTAAGPYRRAYMIDADGTQKTIYISDAPLTGAIPVFVGEGQINVAVPTESTHAANKGYVDQQDLTLGSTVDISIDKRTYIMTLRLKNSAGTILSTAEVDFPLESVVVSGEYHDGILTLRLVEGEPIDIDISHMVSGLVNTATYEAEIEKIGKRIDKANKDHAAELSASIDSERRLAIILKNGAGEVLSKGIVNLPEGTVKFEDLTEEQIEMLRSKELASLELPQEWNDINEAYEAIKEDDHKLLGGVIYKDFEGNIRVFPLSPPYGIRTDEVGAEYAQSSIAMYNSAQQLLVKPAALTATSADGRHAVPLRQLDAIFGGGSLSELGEKACSLRYLPPVDMSEPDDDNRMPYVFCRDTQNIFSRKFYNERPLPDTLVERMPNGQIACLDPVGDGNPVTLGYFNKAIAKYLAKTGGTLTGNLEVKTSSNPSVKFTDSSDGNSAAYVQAYNGKAYMGYGASNSISVDKSGNVGVPGKLSVAGAPQNNTDAVNLEYFNNALKNKAPAYTYGTTDIEAGSASTEPNGTLHFVYE